MIAEERKACRMPLVPGERIITLLRKWDEHDHYNNEDIESWQNEIWVSLAEFEASLRQDAANAEH